MTIRLVVDASVAVKWLVDEEHSAAAKRLIGGPYELHAPRLLASEVANALWRKARLDEIVRRAAGSIAEAIAETPLRWHADERVTAEATRLALALDRPVYDCVYLALAQRIRCRLVTADSEVRACACAHRTRRYRGNADRLGDGGRRLFRRTRGSPTGDRFGSSFRPWWDKRLACDGRRFRRPITSLGQIARISLATNAQF